MLRIRNIETSAVSLFADLSLGLSEDVGEWTNGSEIIVMFQFFNSIDLFVKEIYR